MKEAREIHKFKDAQQQSVKDELAMEVPITIFLNKEEVVTLLCTPEYLADLSVGFLMAEGIIGPEQKPEVIVDEGKGIAWVECDTVSGKGLPHYSKRMITTGCGKGTSLYHYYGKKKVITSSLQASLHAIFDGIRDMHSQSDLYRATGGVHSSALADVKGTILLFREDVGRHNAADKILGHCITQGLSLDDKIFMTSGRISSEIVSKVAQMGIPIIVSRSAPTTLAVDIADELGLTVVGFVRGKRANVYTHIKRIVPWQEEEKPRHS